MFGTLPVIHVDFFYANVQALYDLLFLNKFFRPCSLTIWRTINLHSILQQTHDHFHNFFNTSAKFCIIIQNILGEDNVIFSFRTINPFRCIHDEVSVRS